MQLKPKELAKIRKRRKLWATMGWYWPFKRNTNSRYSTEYTDNPEDGKGIGFFRKNHSLNCGCTQCSIRTFENRRKNRIARKRSKEEINQEIKGL